MQNDAPMIIKVVTRGARRILRKPVQLYAAVRPARELAARKK